MARPSSTTPNDPHRDGEPRRTRRGWRYVPDPVLRGRHDELADRRDRMFNDRLRAHDTVVRGWSTAWGAVVVRIETLTGSRAEVIVPMEPEPIARLRRLAKHAMLSGPPDRLVALASNQCHGNSLWLAAKHGWLVGTGFAGSDSTPMSEWRSHSWCVDPATGEIVETTEAHFRPVTRYVGVVLPPEAAYPLIP